MLESKVLIGLRYYINVPRFLHKQPQIRLQDRFSEEERQNGGGGDGWTPGEEGSGGAAGGEDAKEDAQDAGGEEAQEVPFPAKVEAGEKQEFDVAAAHGFYVAEFFVEQHQGQ